VEGAVRVVWSAAALADLDRFARFLQKNHPALAGIVAREIIAKVQVLQQQPRIGRTVGKTRYRQLVLRVLNAAYVFRYRAIGERLVILRVFHRRERRS
jgi:plasmid stabilization system protein ParE